jgi:nicotinamide mononucleotide transporter
MWLYQVSFFLFFYIGLYFSLVYLKQLFFEGAIPWADAFASAAAFTGMWLMTRKKVESWYWWIATNFASIPLYFVKGLALTSVYYLILLVFAFWGLAGWKKRAKAYSTTI